MQFKSKDSEVDRFRGNNQSIFQIFLRRTMVYHRQNYAHKANPRRKKSGNKKRKRAGATDKDLYVALSIDGRQLDAQWKIG